MTKKLIDLYKEWMEKGRLPLSGLCGSVPKKYIKSLAMVSPTKKDKEILRRNGNPVGFWGAPSFNVSDIMFNRGFTPLRQTIVLFICAMHNEL